MDGTVLIADDDQTMRTVLTQAFSRAGCRVHATSSLTTLLRWVAEGKGDLIISDVVMPDGNGLETLPSIFKKRPNIPVIIISARNTIMTAIQASEANAYDYLPKPFDLPDLMKRAARALHDRSSRSAHTPELAEELPNSELPLIGQTAIMQRLYRMVAHVIGRDVPVLLSGESGTGKTLIARTIHDFSDRRSLPFLNITEADLRNIRAPMQLLNRARGGTILIESLEEIDTELQRLILQTVDAEIDHPPQFITTSQLKPARLQSISHIRRDVFFRLSAAQILLPPLCERIDDIPLLVEHFVASMAGENGSSQYFCDSAIGLLKKYIWPGNVRQLENVVRSLLLTSTTSEISLGEVEDILGNQDVKASDFGAEDPDELRTLVARYIQRYFDLYGDDRPPPGVYLRILRDVEFPLIQVAMDAAGGNLSTCANILGLHRNTLRKKIKELNIRSKRVRRLR
ncbi:MAG: sigma-54 dependent transcriptional regulator [Aestuariivita sp.]|nr:sigma-54 dependent transcriptional regulator [Aestuariivita sp.]